MAPSQKVEKSAISITHVETNMMVVSPIKNQLKIWRRIEKSLYNRDFQKFIQVQSPKLQQKLAEPNET